MVGVAQLVEHQIVALRVAGSSPVIRPSLSSLRALSFFLSAKIDHSESLSLDTLTARQFYVRQTGI